MAGAIDALAGTKEVGERELRKEVVVAGRVFDLGLKGLDDAITEGERDGQTMELQVGPTVFQVGVLRQDRAFCLHWTGMTNFQNIIWMRFVVLGPWWPPVKSLSCFTYARESVSV